MAPVLTSAQIRRQLMSALEEIRPDDLYFGSRFMGGYRYHGNGSHMIDFPKSDASDGALFQEKMTGSELAQAIRGELSAEHEHENVARRAVGLAERPNPYAPKPYLPEGWTESTPGGMATNAHPTEGGIVDRTMVTNEWFVIFHRDGLQVVEGLGSRDEAFQVFEERMAQAAEAELTSSAPGP